MKRAKAPGKVVNHKILAWERYCSTLGLHNTILRSAEYDKSDPESTYDASRVLNWNSTNCVGLFALLLKWSFSKKENGGFGSLDERMRTMEFLRRLCAIACKDGSFSFSIATDSSLTYDGKIDGHMHVRIDVDRDGELCLDEFLSMAVPMAAQNGCSCSSARLTYRCLFWGALHALA